MKKKIRWNYGIILAIAILWPTGAMAAEGRALLPSGAPRTPVVQEAEPAAPTTTQAPAEVAPAKAEEAQTEAEETGTVHKLPAITVEDREVTSGLYSIEGEALRTIPNRTGTVTGALKAMPNVQYSITEGGSQQGGEISPPRISIYGAKPYENNFMIDGMTITNTLNPVGLEGYGNDGLLSGNQNDLIPAGGDQDIFYDTELIESIDIYTNNVPAKYGNFVGGVVDASLRDPRTDKWHFRLKGAMTESRWYGTRDTDESSQDAYSQPNYDIYNYSVLAEGPVTENFAVMFGYTGTYSNIPLTFEDNDTEGVLETKDQKRFSQNFFAKATLQATEDLRFSLDASYAPYEDYRWRTGWDRSGQNMTNDALRVALQTEYATMYGDFDVNLSYLHSGYSIDADENYVFTDTMADQSWGGYGDRETQKDQFIAKLDYESPRFGEGWFNWKVDTGVELNVTAMDVWAEEAAGDIWVVLPTMSIRTLSEYDESSQSNSLTTLGFYVQSEFNFERVTFTPGLRVDTDFFTDNVDVAPRLKLEVDVLNNDMFRVVGGYNRYYGSALRQYAFDQYRPFKTIQTRTLTGLDPTTTYRLGADRTFDIDGVKTPHADEYTVGLMGTIAEFDYSLDFTYREYKNQLLTEEVGERDLTVDGLDYTESIYELNNDGYSQYKGATLTVGRGFDLGKWGSHYIGLGATISETKTFNGAYNNETDLSTSYGRNYDYGNVYYNGEYVSRSSLPADDYNAPLTLTLNIRSSFWDDRIRVNWVNRWRDSSEGLMYDSRYSDETPYGTTSGSTTSTSSSWVNPDGDYVDAYKEGHIKGGLVSDINIEVDLYKDEDLTFGLSLDAYNIFNTSSETAVSSGYENRSAGTSYWLGFYATY